MYKYVKVLELKSKLLAIYEKSNGEHLAEEDRAKRDEILKEIKESEGE
jgi:hypothetical protein